MQFAIPSQIQVGGVTYQVKVCDPGTHYRPVDMNWLGEADHRKTIIWLAADQSLEQLHATFWHEVLHTAEYLHQGGAADDKNNEDRCQLFSSIIMQVLKQL